MCDKCGTEGLTGFQRLDKIMSIQPDVPEEGLAEYKPMWSSMWAAVMSNMSQEMYLDE